MTYRVWDDETGNFIASFGTQDEAVVFFREMLDANDADTVRELSVIGYPSDGGKPVLVLEGAEFLESMTVPA